MFLFIVCLYVCLFGLDDDDDNDTCANGFLGLFAALGSLFVCMFVCLFVVHDHDDNAAG